jgi:2-polyprenyl-3-methyl-5-hydroxy-6-metoxy-1,4-benzoquinol methylase
MTEREISRQERAYERLVSSSDWDEFANTFETSRRIEVIFDRLLGDVALCGLSLLDAGSGGGHFSAEACRRGAQVTSMDIGEKLLAQVAKRCNSTRVLGSILNPPFETESFDIVLSTEVIEHTPTPMAALKQLTRVVQPGGILVITTPCRLWQPVVRLASTLKLRPYDGFENFVWPHKAAQIIQDAGFVLEDKVGFNLLPLFDARFQVFHALADRMGRVAPSLYVNFAIRARRFKKH